MQIVIDISDELKNKIDACDDDSYSSIIRWYDTTLYDAIRNGTLLPKGHGKLIDYSWVVENIIKKLGIKDERYLLEAEKALMSIVEIAPTIIEADKEKERK